MAAVSKFNHDVNALFRGQTCVKARVGLVSFCMSREYLNDFIHNFIVSTWESGLLMGSGIEWKMKCRQARRHWLKPCRKTR